MRLSDIKYAGDYISRPYYNINRQPFDDLPKWLQKAVLQKNPRLTLDLANSYLLVYADLDRKRLTLTRLN
jgi:hypothetical protein